MIELSARANFRYAMDIHEFASALQIFNANESNQQRDYRLAHAINGHSETPYLAQAKRLSLAGRAFESHYWHLLPRYFDSGTLSFAKHCLLNFAVQQLSIRALNQPNKNRYLYIGDSAEDLAASLFCAPHFLPATWVRNKAGVDEAYKRLLELLARANVDDLQGVSLDTARGETPFLNEKPKSCGLVVINFHDRKESVASLLADALNSLSLGGTVLLLFPGEPEPITLPDLSILTVKLPNNHPEVMEAAVIVRSAL